MVRVISCNSWIVLYPTTKAIHEMHELHEIHELVEQHLRSGSAKLLQLCIPRASNLLGGLSAFQSFERVGINQQSQVTIDFPFRRVKLAQRHCDLHSVHYRPKARTVSDNNVYPTTLFVLKHRSFRSELYRHKANARNSSTV